MSQKQYPLENKTYETFSEQQTLQIGETIGKQAQPGSLYCLVGDLGTGKTVLARGMARGLGVTGSIVSPTFTIVHEYQGRLPYYHFDIYRLEDEDELDEIGWNDYLGRGGVCLVEWADLAAEAMPSDAWWVYLSKDLSKGVNYRKIQVHRGPMTYDDSGDRGGR